MKVSLWMRVVDTPFIGNEKIMSLVLDWPDGYRIPVVDEDVPLLWQCDPNEGDASSRVDRVSWCRDYDEEGWPLIPAISFGLHHTDGAGNETRTPYIERELLDRMAAEGWKGWP